MRRILPALALIVSGCYHVPEVESLPQIDVETTLIDEFFEAARDYSDPVPIGNDMPIMCTLSLELVRPLEQSDPSATVWLYDRKFDGKKITTVTRMEQSGIPIHFVLTNRSLKRKDGKYDCIEEYLDADVAVDQNGIILGQRPDGVPDYVSVTAGCVNEFGFMHTMEVINSDTRDYGGQVNLSDLPLVTREFFEDRFSDSLSSEIDYLANK